MAVEMYQKIINGYRLEVEAYQRLAWLLISMERFDEAELVIKRGLSVDPESQDLYNSLGMNYSLQYKYPEAIAAFQHYVQLAPKDPNALDSLALCYQRFGHYDEAIAAYQHALSINAESRVALQHLGNCYAQQGRYREALEQYRRHLQIAQDDWSRQRSWEYIAVLYFKWGNLDEAERAANQAIKYYQKNAGTDQANLWILPLLAFARGDQEQIERLKQRFLSPQYYTFSVTVGELGVYYNSIGYFSLKSGQTGEAIQNFKEAIRHKRPYWFIDPLEDCLANAYLELGQWDEAIAEYQRIIKINDHYPLAHFHLAQAYEGKGEPDKVRAEFENFLQSWPQADSDLPEINTAKQYLARK
jgi:tetratricopeptide (TPR) repeat protein